MSKTILITGASSGYGKATAERFLDGGWNVIATMRKPDPSVYADAGDRLRVLALDVTNEASIAEARAQAGEVDVVVNNAGIGLVGAFEATPMAAIRQLFDTNTLGVMAVTQAFVEQMRQRRSGMIVNVTSSVTLAPFPLAAAYTATKQAIEGFTASLAHELGYFDVGVRLVEPGYAPTTSFSANAIVPLESLLPQTYAGFAKPILDAFGAPALTTKVGDVAEAVWAAVHDGAGQLRYPAGADAVALAGGQ